MSDLFGGGGNKKVDPVLPNGALDPTKATMDQVLDPNASEATRNALSQGFYSKLLTEEQKRRDNYGKDFSQYLADSAAMPGRQGTILTDKGIDFANATKTDSVL